MTQQLQPLADGIWTANHPLRLFGRVAIGHRMTVLRAADDSLIVHSPVPLSDELREELKGIGPVSCVLAPNQFHDLYLRRWSSGYPEARFLAAPGLRERRPDLTFHDELTAATVAAIDPRLETIAIAGIPRINETVLIHPPSRTLILADLMFNLDAGGNLATRCMKLISGIGGRPAVSRLFKLCIKDRRAYRRSIDELLERDFDRVVVGHGEVIDRGGRELLAQVVGR